VALPKTKPKAPVSSKTCVAVAREQKDKMGTRAERKAAEGIWRNALIDTVL